MNARNNVGDIRTVYHGVPSIEELHRLADQLSPELRRTVLYGMWQSWLHPETNTDTAPDGHRWLPYNPSWDGYRGREGVREFIAEAHRLGFRVLVFTNLIAVNWGHPLLWQQPIALQTQLLDPAQREAVLARPRTRSLAYIHQADRRWQQFCIDTLRKLVADYDIDAVYLDCSSVVHNGIVREGLNPYQGAAAWHQTVRQALPELALLGEQIHEATLAGEAFALDAVFGWGSEAIQPLLKETAHPLNGLLMNRYCNRFRWQRGEWGSWQDTEERGCHVANHFLDKIRVFGRYDLRYSFPQQWEPDVRVYLKSNDGRTFRFVDDRGSRFEAIDGAGQREMFYWRLHDAKRAPAHSLLG